MTRPWLEDADLTITVVRNPKFKSLAEVLETVHDYENRTPKYHVDQRITLDQAFNTHDDTFYVLGRNLGDDKYLLVENNGYYGMSGWGRSADCGAMGQTLR